MLGRDDQQTGEANAWAPAEGQSPDDRGRVSTLDSDSWIPADDAPASEQETATWSAPERHESWHSPEAHARAGRNGGDAVFAFFAELCGRAGAGRYAAEAIGLFESRVNQGELAPTDDSLRSVAGEVAVHRKLLASPRAGWRAAVRGALSQEGTCAATAGLLAARSAGTLEPGDEEALRRHLHECLPCRAAEVRWQRAERAFAGTLQFGGAVGADAAAAEPVSAFAPAAAATAAAPAPAAAQDEPAPFPTRPPRRARGRRLAGVPLVALVAFAAICAAAVAFAVTSGNSSHKPTQQAVQSVPSVPATPARPPVKAHHVRAHPRHVVTHHARPVHHAKPKPAVVTASASPPAVRYVAPAPAPAAPAPVSTPAPAPVAPSSGGGGGSGGGGSSTASIQQPSLGSTSAPTGISSKP